MKKNIIFFMKCILVIFPFIWIITYTKNNMLAFADSEAPYYIWNREFCTTEQEKQYDVVILGDSVANAAYMPEMLSDTSINLSLGGTTPMENYYLLKEYLANNKAPLSVYISFMDFHLYTSDGYWWRSMYSHRYTIKDSWEMLKKAKEFEDRSIAWEASNLDFLAYQIYFPSKYITSLSNASFNQRYDSNMEAYALNEIHRGRYIARGTNEWNETDVNFDTFYVAPLFDYYYKLLIELCLENNMEVHIIKLPLPNTNTFSDQYYEQFDNYYEKLQEAYPEITVEWWDNYDSWFFYDQHHMNTHGAFRFTTELKEKYPEDFNENFTYAQIEGISDSIKNENYISELFRWAKSCPVYSLIVYDGVGDFPLRYEEEFKQDGLIIREKSFDSETVEIYVIGSFEISSIFDQIDAEDGIVKVYPKEERGYKWKPGDFYGINILVVDNYNKTVVCEKKFQLIENSCFELQ